MQLRREDPLSDRCSPQWLDRWSDSTSLLAIAAIAIVIRLYLALTSFCISGDGVAYVAMARDIAAGDVAAALHSVFSPLYPLLIAAVHRVLPDWELAGSLVSALMGTAAVATIYGMTHEAFARRDLALGAAALAAIHPELAAYSGTVRTEAGYIFLTTGAVWLLLRSLRTRRLMTVAAAGAIGGLAYLYRSEAIGLPLVAVAAIVAAALVWHRCGFGWALGAVAVFASGFLAVAAPYLVYLRASMGHWTIGREFTAAMMYGMGEVARNSEEWRQLGYSTSVSPLTPVFTDPRLYMEKVAGDFATSFYNFVQALDPLLTILLVAGLWRRGRALIASFPEALLAFLIAFYFCGLAFSYTGTRFMVHLIPFVFGWAMLGLEAATAAGVRLARGVGWRLPAAAIPVAVALVLMPRTLWPIGYDMRGIRYAGEEIAHRDAKPGAVVARDGRIAWYAGAKFIALPEDPEPNLCRWLAIQPGADYLIVADQDERRLGGNLRDEHCLEFFKRYPRRAGHYYDLFFIRHGN